jgi:predicted Zn-dependent protease
MLATHGPDALGKMLACYRDNLNTRQALQRSFNVEQEKFEQGYKEYVAKIVAKLDGAAEPAAEKSLSELRKAYAAKPEDPEAAAALARAYLQRKLYSDAGKLADRVLAAEPKHQLANYIKAKLLLVIGERDAALKKLEIALDREQPQADLLKLLAGMKYQAGELDEAAKLYELGRRHEPFEPDWIKSLALVRLKAGDKEKLGPLLEELAERDRDDLAIRKKLAQLALLEKDYPAAEKWANQCLNIDVLDNIAHRVLAQSLAYQKEWDGAIEEYQVAIKLSPKNFRLRLALAETFRAANRSAEARTTLEALLKLNPDLPAAKSMLEKLDP